MKDLKVKGDLETADLVMLHSIYFWTTGEVAQMGKKISVEWSGVGR